MNARWPELERRAKDASANAHCPYSRFAVGAAVLTSDGVIASGCNVENASFGLTICAERNAVFAAVASGAKTIVALALYTPTAKPATPCGACRQVLAEFGPAMTVRCICDGTEAVEFRLEELLPAAFGLPSATAAEPVSSS